MKRFIKISLIIIAVILAIFITKNKVNASSGEYIGNINSEIIKMSLIPGNYRWDTFISGEIVVVEWVDGKSTVPTETPEIRLKSVDGTVSVDAFVTPTGTNTYYFDRILSGIDVTKEYYLEVKSGDEKNVSENKSMNAYFTNTQYNNKTLGIYYNGWVNDKENYGKEFNVKVSGQKISFEEIK